MEELQVIRSNANNSEKLGDMSKLTTVTAQIWEDITNESSWSIEFKPGSSIARFAPDSIREKYPEAEGPGFSSPCSKLTAKQAYELKKGVIDEVTEYDPLQVYKEDITTEELAHQLELLSRSNQHYLVQHGDCPSWNEIATRILDSNILSVLSKLQTVQEEKHIDL